MTVDNVCGLHEDDLKRKLDGLQWKIWKLVR
jgi:hypothetical protein